MTYLTCDSPRQNVFILRFLLQIQVSRNGTCGALFVSRDYTSEGLAAFLRTAGSLLMSANASFVIAASPNDLMAFQELLSS